MVLEELLENEEDLKDFCLTRLHEAQEHAEWLQAIGDGQQESSWVARVAPARTFQARATPAQHNLAASPHSGKRARAQHMMVIC